MDEKAEWAVVRVKDEGMMLHGGCTVLLSTRGLGLRGFRCWLQLVHCTYLLSRPEHFIWISRFEA